MRCKSVSDITVPDSLLSVVVATTAFGMGIDSPNIRHVIHWGPPSAMQHMYKKLADVSETENNLSPHCMLQSYTVLFI